MTTGLHEAAVRLEPATDEQSGEVISISRGRVTTARRLALAAGSGREHGRVQAPAREDLTVQLQIYGGKNAAAWHRKMVGGYTTACGVNLTLPENKALGYRHESYLDVICDEGCYSPAELAESRRVNEAARAADLDDKR